MKNSIKYLYKMNLWVNDMKYTLTSKLFKEVYKAFARYIKPYCISIDYVQWDEEKDSFGIAFLVNTEDYQTNDKLINDFVAYYQLDKYLQIYDVIHIKMQKYFQTQLQIKLTKTGDKHKKDLIGLLLLRE